MSTQIIVEYTRSAKSADQPLEEQMRQNQSPLAAHEELLGNREVFAGKSLSELPSEQSCLADNPAKETVEATSQPRTKAIFEDFVNLVERIPKVWAVYMRCDSPVVHIWTFVDSTDWRDRSPVYEAEWGMLNRYPETPFDFNVELAPAGSENFEGEKTAFVFKR